MRHYGRSILGAALLAGTALPALADGSVTETITVTAQRLAAARNDIQTQTGASTYAITAQAMDTQPGGQNNPLNQVLLQAPGVAQDSFGQIHVRGEHNGLQYRLNGVILPEGISVFGQTLSPRLAERVTLITGALPAEYGLRTAGIIDLTTKAGTFNQGGEIGLYGGSHGEIQPSLEAGGSFGHLNYFVSGSYLQNGLGIESPDGRSNPIHDDTQQGQGFSYFEDFIDDSSKISLILGFSRAQFQIPDQAGLQPASGNTVLGQTAFPSERLNETQREITSYGILSYLHTTTSVDFQVSAFGRHSSLYFTPDVLGDLLFNGVAETARKEDTAGGLQIDGAIRLTPTHTLRAGALMSGERGLSRTLSQVLPTDDTGAQTSDQPVSVFDKSGKTAWTYSVYAQDEWKILPDLTFNFGGRFDLVEAYVHASQFSPRANLVWRPLEATTIHVGYARYFSPPPFELVGAKTLSLFTNTTGAPAVAVADTPKAERANYYDAGISQRILAPLTVGLDVYYKTSRDLIDEGQFGAPIILTPFNYAQGRQYGAELSVSYQQNPWSAYANFAASRAVGKTIVSSEFNFPPDALDFIAHHFIHLDHDQTLTGSAGLAYQWQETRLSADLLVQSGLRAAKVLADGSTIPNGSALPTYAQVNFGVIQGFTLPGAGAFKARFDVINLFDDKNAIRNGTGVGVGAPQFGPRRGFFGGLSKLF